MLWTERTRHVKIALVVAAVLIAAMSLVASFYLIRDLKAEEHRKMEIWAKAMQALQEANEKTDLSMVFSVIESNHTIPVIVIDPSGNVMDCRNVDVGRNSSQEDSIAKIKEIARNMQSSGNTLRMNLTQQGVEGLSPEYITVCYGESLMLGRLSSYPFVQLGVVGLFMAVAIFALLSLKRAEQNRVWVGLSRETAHQLGTPISSLMAWNQILQEQYPDDTLLPEMETDVKRLQLIAERFSKIGSKPELKLCDLLIIVQATVDYMRRRAPEHVRVNFMPPEEEVPEVRLSAPLFQWVLENLCKNAMDAMPDGRGEINISIVRKERKIRILVQDTGKGINKKNFKNVFKPGFTTKQRGWGLGLSLAKRIVEEYHKGAIYVKDSQIGKGTTFAIDLNIEQ